MERFAEIEYKNRLVREREAKAALGAEIDALASVVTRLGERFKFKCTVMDNDWTDDVVLSAGDYVDRYSSVEVFPDGSGEARFDGHVVNRAANGALSYHVLRGKSEFEPRTEEPMADRSAWKESFMVNLATRMTPRKGVVETVREKVRDILG